MVPDPAQPDLANIEHSRCRAQRLLSLVDQGGSTASISRR
jgi:hypothetical protein